MKTKVIGLVLVFMCVSTAVFAGKFSQNEMQCIGFLEKSDVQSMEHILQENSRQMDLSALLYTTIVLRINNNRNSASNVIQILLKYGVDPNVMHQYFYLKSDNEIRIRDLTQDIAAYNYPLGQAIKNGFNVQTIKLLLDAGARLLIENGFNVNGPYTSTVTLLGRAVSGGQIAIVRLLVESGAKVNQQDQNWGNKTPAQIAYENKEIDIYNYLKEHGAVWTAPGQAASAASASPPPSSVTNNYNYSPPPSSSSSSSSSSARPAPSTPKLSMGRYAFGGTNVTMDFNLAGLTIYSGYTAVGNGSYRINGTTLTITVFNATGAASFMNGRTYAYTITSDTSFSGSGETWYKR